MTARARCGEPPQPRAQRHRLVWLVVLLAALCVAVVASIAVGTNPLTPTRVVQAVLHPDDSEASVIVWTIRGPRTLLAILVAAACGVAGALIQALTRNPLADPGMLGVNAGAGFAVTLGAGILGTSHLGGTLWFAFGGAAIATVAVVMIGASGRMSLEPVTLVLAGVALSAVLGGMSRFLALIDEHTFRVVQGWGLGSVARGTLSETLFVAPFLLVGLALAVLLARPLNALALGGETAASLGVRIMPARVLVIIAVTLLAGGATALTGGLLFVGMMVPHAVRWCTGPDQRWIIAGSAIAAPVLVLAADVVGRVVAYPGEIPVGIMTALVGAPVLIALVRRRRIAAL